MIKKDVMLKYNISDATLRNWMKLGYIDNLINISEKKIIKIIDTKKSTGRTRKAVNIVVLPYPTLMM